LAHPQDRQNEVRIGFLAGKKADTDKRKPRHVEHSAFEQNHPIGQVEGSVNAYLYKTRQDSGGQRKESHPTELVGIGQECFPNDAQSRQEHQGRKRQVNYRVDQRSIAYGTQSGFHGHRVEYLRSEIEEQDRMSPGMPCRIAASAKETQGAY